MAETSKVLTLVFTDLADSTAVIQEHGKQSIPNLIRTAVVVLIMALSDPS